MAGNEKIPVPLNEKFGSKRWLDWFRQLDTYFTTDGTVSWALIDLTGSDLADLATKNHNDLDNKQGGTSGEFYHLTLDQYNAASYPRGKRMFFGSW